MDKELIRVENLKKYYDIKGGIVTHTISQIQAVDGVDFSIKKGETLGLVGESGCGKSTIGQLLVGLLAPTDGAIYYRGKKIGAKSLTHSEKKARKQVGTNLQMIFQDSYSSLNPRKHIYDILAQPMLYHGVADKGTIDNDLNQLLDMVGLPKSALLKYPHEFSGGQRQRIGIAKALSLKPEFIVCDEPVSALDVSIQAQILNLIRELQNELELTSLFVGHGLGAVRYVSDRIAVMYLGRIRFNASIFTAQIHLRNSDILQILVCGNIDNHVMAVGVYYRISYLSRYIDVPLDDLLDRDFPNVILVSAQREVHIVGKVYPGVGQDRDTVQRSKSLFREFGIIHTRS